MVHGIKCPRYVELDHNGGTAGVDGTVDVIRYLEQQLNVFDGMRYAVWHLSFISYSENNNKKQRKREKMQLKPNN